MIALVCALAAGATADAQPLPRAPLFGFGKPKPPPALVFAYHGWKIDAARTARALPAERTVRAIEAQLELVERQSLPPPVLSLMREAPIIAVAGAPSAVIYANGAVVLDARRLDPRKPAALFGLLQAYAERGLPGGLANPDLERFRRQAIAARIWPNAALMLQSNGDFFAATATAYLTGATTREPYTRAHLKQTQPQYCAWLDALFGRGPGRPPG